MLLLAYTTWNCYGVYVEEPRFFDSATGHKSAKTGSLLKLMAAATASMAVGWTTGASAAWVPIHEWKGQLPKDVVTRRIIQRLGDAATADVNDHAWDAVGMGLHLKGYFG